MKSLLIPILALTALFAIPPAAICDDLPSASDVVQMALQPVDTICHVVQIEPREMAVFDIGEQAMHKNIIAKLHCESVLVTQGQEQVKLRAVHGDSEENKSFSKYTPSANFELSITNPAAIGAFEPGRDYLVTITAADAPAPA